MLKTIKFLQFTFKLDFYRIFQKILGLCVPARKGLATRVQHSIESFRALCCRVGISQGETVQEGKVFTETSLRMRTSS